MNIERKRKININLKVIEKKEAIIRQKYEKIAIKIHFFLFLFLILILIYREKEKNKYKPESNRKERSHNSAEI